MSSDLDPFDQAMLNEAKAIKREADAIVRFVDTFLVTKYGPPGETVPPEAPSANTCDPACENMPEIYMCSECPGRKQSADPAPYTGPLYGQT